MENETFPYAVMLYFSCPVGFQPLQCFLETVPRKLFQPVISFAPKPPPEAGVVGGGVTVLGHL